jgi:hypothetical protein
MVRRFQPWAALLLLTTAALACAAPQPAAPPTTAALPTPDPGRVRFDEGGFSMTLPQGWSVAGPFAAQVDGAAYSLYALGIDPGASGGPGTSQIIVAEAAQLTAEAFAAAQCTTCPTSPFVDVQLGGLPARRIPIGGGGVPFVVEWTFVEREGKLIGFSIRDPETLATLEDVLRSVQFDAGGTP